MNVASKAGRGAELVGPEEFRIAARQWLEGVAEPRRSYETAWGEGSDSVAVFDNWTVEEERKRAELGRAWERQRFDAGWGALAWPSEYGGRGLPQSYDAIYEAEEAQFEVPRRNELFNTTQRLIAPTIAAWGTDQQKARFVRAMLRTDLLCCQLFSEPGAGSDLAAVSTRAARDGEEWLLTGQKVWTSNAKIAEWGEAIVRTSSDSKHGGLTAFLVPMNAEGLEIRPIRQMSGGASFNEVFLSDVRVPDSLRLGAVGSGWQVALTTLSAERASSSGFTDTTADHVIRLARHLQRTAEPVVRDALATLWINERVKLLNDERVKASLLGSDDPGPVGSIGKLMATENMRFTSDVVSILLGPRLQADSGEWGTYAWAEQVLGAPGYRIAAGSDEIQRNIIGERVLGLPREPRPPE